MALIQVMLQFIITFKTSILDITSNFCFQKKKK